MVKNTSAESVEDPITLKFSLQDNVDGVPVTPDHVSLSMLKDFVSQVADFVKGSRRLDAKISTAVEEGSLVLATSGQPAFMAEVKVDYEKAASSDDISDLDPGRRKIINQWQNLARLNEGRVYTLTLGGKDVKRIVINADSEYHASNNVWVEVEKYVYGEIYDMGGKSKANVHVQLENGRSLTVSSDTKLLASDKENRLYQKQLLRIKALYNVKTELLKDEELLGYEHYYPHYDEAQLVAIQEKGAAVWEGASPTSWVEAMRGNDG